MASYKRYCILICFLISVIRLVAQDGSLDSSFNQTGILPTSDRSYENIKLQSNGKILLTGTGNITRHNAEGAPDLSFGINGVDTILAGSGPFIISFMSIQSDNKIILFGFSISNDSLYQHHYIICRRLADGKPDNSLNGTGFAVGPIRDDSIIYSKMILQPDNKILLSAWETHQTRFLVTRLYSNGAIDAAFGIGGTAYTTFSKRAYVTALALQKDEKIVAVGLSTADSLGFNTDSLAIARYNPDGTPDHSFGASGKLTYSPVHDQLIGPGAEGQAVTIQPDGKIVVGGIYGFDQSHGRWLYTNAQVWRFNLDGSWDTTFNGNGIQTITYGNTVARIIDIGLECDDKIVLAMNVGTVDFINVSIASARTNRDGSLDSSYGTKGFSPYYQYDTYGNIQNISTADIAFSPNRLYMVSAGYNYPRSILAFKQSATIDSSNIHIVQTCFGDTTVFSLTRATTDSVRWDFGDGNVSKILSASAFTKHFYINKGSFRVSCLIYKKCGVSLANKTILIVGANDLQLGNDTSICEGRRITLQANIPGQFYMWSTGAVTDSIVVSQTGNYSVSVNSNGCIIRDTIFVTFAKSAVLHLGNDTTLCTGTTITLVVKPPFTTILWDDNSKLPERTVNKAGVYSVSVTLNGCSVADTIVIEEQGAPYFFLGADTSLCYGGQVILHPAVSADRFLWEDGSVAIPRTIAAADLYKLTAYNTCGSFSDEIRIDYHLCEALMPSAFTPNQDGLNDEFRFKSPGAVSDFSMQVYNRLGQLLFTTSNAGKGWDGTWHGVKQATGSYVWKMHYKNANSEAKKFKGMVLLIR